MIIVIVVIVAVVAGVVIVMLCLKKKSKSQGPQDNTQNDQEKSTAPNDQETGIAPNDQTEKFSNDAAGNTGNQDSENQNENNQTGENLNVNKGVFSVQELPQAISLSKPHNQVNGSACSEMNDTGNNDRCLSAITQSQNDFPLVNQVNVPNSTGNAVLTEVGNPAKSANAMQSQFNNFLEGNSVADMNEKATKVMRNFKTNSLGNAELGIGSYAEIHDLGIRPERLQDSGDRPIQDVRTGF